MKLSATEAGLYLVAVLIFAAAYVLWEAPRWLLYIFVGVAGVLSFMVRGRPASKKENRCVSPYVVSFDETGVTVSIAGTKRESVAWGELIFVGIRIETQGFIDLPYWVLGGRTGGCLYPSDALGNELLLQELQSRLPDFDNEAVVRGMGLLEGVVVWTRADSSSSSALSPEQPTQTRPLGGAANAGA